MSRKKEKIVANVSAPIPIEEETPDVAEPIAANEVVCIPDRVAVLKPQRDGHIHALGAVVGEPLLVAVVGFHSKGNRLQIVSTVFSQTVDVPGDLVLCEFSELGYQDGDSWVDSMISRRRGGVAVSRQLWNVRAVKRGFTRASFDITPAGELSEEVGRTVAALTRICQKRLETGQLGRME